MAGGCSIGGIRHVSVFNTVCVSGGGGDGVVTHHAWGVLGRVKGAVVKVLRSRVARSFHTLVQGWVDELLPVCARTDALNVVVSDNVVQLCALAGNHAERVRMRTHLAYSPKAKHEVKRDKTLAVHVLAQEIILEKILQGEIILKLRNGNVSEVFIPSKSRLRSRHGLVVPGRLTHVGLNLASAVGVGAANSTERS